MYIMLSIEATVYADSNDKYSSIFQISKKKKSWDYYQNLNIVLSIYMCFWSLVPGVCCLLKCPVPSLTWPAERSVCFPYWKVAQKVNGALVRAELGKKNTFFCFKSGVPEEEIHVLAYPATDLLLTIKTNHSQLQFQNL